MDWPLIDPLIHAALAEDVATGDVTSLATMGAKTRASGAIVAKQGGVVCGLDVAGRVFSLVDEATVFEKEAMDGDSVEPGTVLATVSGSARSLLTAERVALNFLGHLSGVATATHGAVQKLAGTRTRVLDTRKTIPGLRLLEKYAVRCGGGVNHRMGLYDMVLIKENHIAAAGGITRAVAGARKHAPELLVEVEVTSLEELEEALTCGVDRIMLDNFDLAATDRAVARVEASAGGGKRPELEVSGNVTEDRLRKIAEAGVDFVSMGAITHSAPNFDVSFRLHPLEEP